MKPFLLFLALVTMAAAARTINVLGVSGSLRKASVNSQLLNIIGTAAGTDALPNVNFTVADISALPMYNTDLEETKDGTTVFPDAVEAFRAQVAAADAFIFATPEYNFGLSGALKNAIDWASRGGNPMQDKAAAMVGAGGRMGTSRAQFHLRGVGVFMKLHFVNSEVCLNIWDGSGNVDMGTYEVKADGKWRDMLVKQAGAVRDLSQQLLAGKEAMVTVGADGEAAR